MCLMVSAADFTKDFINCKGYTTELYLPVMSIISIPSGVDKRPYTLKLTVSTLTSYYKSNVLQPNDKNVSLSEHSFYPAK